MVDRVTIGGMHCAEVLCSTVSDDDPLQAIIVSQQPIQLLPMIGDEMI